MPKTDHRGSLMNLRTSLPKVAPIQTTEQMENQILGSATEETGRSEFKAAENPAVPDRGQQAPPAVAGRREGTVLLNAKIPLSVHTRLKRTAQYNDVSMTDILLRGIEHELNSGKYSQPPSAWGVDEGGGRQ